MIYYGDILDMMNYDNSTIFNVALERVRSELGREVTPKDLAYYIGGEPSQWGRILKGATIRSDYAHRIKLIYLYGIKEAVDGLAGKGNCPVHNWTCNNCKRKICYLGCYDEVPYYKQLKKEREDRALNYKRALGIVY
jgi:hypothetical protein